MVGQERRTGSRKKNTLSRRQEPNERFGRDIQIPRLLLPAGVNRGKDAPLLRVEHGNDRSRRELHPGREDVKGRHSDKRAPECRCQTLDGCHSNSKPGKRPRPAHAHQEIETAIGAGETEQSVEGGYQLLGMTQANVERHAVPTLVDFKGDIEQLGGGIDCCGFHGCFASFARSGWEIDSDQSRIRAP